MAREAKGPESPDVPSWVWGWCWLQACELVAIWQSEDARAVEALAARLNDPRPVHEWPEPPEPWMGQRAAEDMRLDPELTERVARDLFSMVRSDARSDGKGWERALERVRGKRRLPEIAERSARLLALARRLRIARAATPYSQAEASRMARMSQTALSFYELGKREPGALALADLASVYGVSVNWLFGLPEGSRPVDGAEAAAMGLTGAVAADVRRDFGQFPGV